MEHIVVLVTAPDEEEAAAMARALVEEELAACVNIVKGVRSIYRWEGNVEDEAEALMVIKTRRGLFDALEARVKAMHSYSAPEVIALDIAQGSKDFLVWIETVTR